MVSFELRSNKIEMSILKIWFVQIEYGGRIRLAKRLLAGSSNKKQQQKNTKKTHKKNTKTKNTKKHNKKHTYCR